MSQDTPPGADDTPTTPSERSPEPPPPDLTSIAQTINDRLRLFFAAERSRWRKIDADLEGPLEALELTVLSGGKRLRPAFCFWGWVCAGGDVHDEASRAEVEELGIGFELLHAFALIHDDVMDNADTRRGVPTTHVTFSERHVDGTWRGESRRFGESVAILVGDLAHVYADALVAGAPLPTRHLWRQMQLELVAGQYLDVLRTADGNIDPRQARLISRLKSGQYTVEHPLRLGASLLAGDRVVPGTLSSSDLDDVLVAYASPLGVAFQQRDDILGVMGDPDRVRKPVGNDLREGKPTLLLALARERANPAQLALLDRVSDPDITDDEIGDVRQVLVDTGAIDSIEDEIETLTTTAIEAINHANVPAMARDALVELAGFVSARRH
jgi:geranylgeranyl diphosphate synthase type I